MVKWHATARCQSAQCCRLMPSCRTISVAKKKLMGDGWLIVVALVCCVVMSSCNSSMNVYDANVVANIAIKVPPLVRNDFIRLPVVRLFTST